MKFSLSSSVMSLAPRRLVISPLRVLLSGLLLSSPLHAGDNNGPGGGGGGCGGGGSNPQSFYWHFGIGKTSYTKQDMLALARKPVSEGFYLGSNPASFDSFFNTSYTQNLTTNWSPLELTIETVSVDQTILLPSTLKMKRNINAEVIEKNGAIRQVLASDTLTDIVPMTVGYHVKVYDRNAKGARDSNGLYTVSSTAVPVAEMIMRTPDGGAFIDTIEYVIVDRKNAGGTRVEVVRHTENHATETHTKSVYAGSLDATGNPVIGGLLETNQVVYSNRGTKPYDYTLTRELKRIVTTAAGPQYGELKLVSRRLEEYRDFTPSTEGSQSSYKRLVREVDGYGSSDERETRYAFYDQSSNPMIHGRLKAMVKPDGNWEYYTYTDSEGAAVFEQTKYSAWRDASFGSAADGFQADLANAKKEVISVGSTTGFTKVISYGGVTTSQEEFSSIPQADGGLLNTLTYKSGTGEILSTRVWALNSSTAAEHLAGRIAWMENPEGTAETYTYTATSNGGFRLVHCKGAGNRNGVTAGNEITTEYNSFVEAYAESTKDIESGLVLNYWIAPTVDILGRPTRIEYNGNQDDYETFEYSCCGLARQRARDASIITWTRDPLKRVYLRNDYRYAADASPLITTTAFDGLTTIVTRGGILQSEASHLLNGDTASIKSPDRDNDGNPETTTVTYASGGRIVTTVNPDGGTEIRENYLDGQPKSFTGTAVADRSYAYGTHTADGNGLWKQDIKLTATGGTGEWAKIYFDAMERPVKTERPYGTSLAIESYSYYGTTASAGSRTRLASETDADSKTTAYNYNAEGEQSTVTEQMPIGQSCVTVTDHDTVNDATLGICHQETATVNGVVTNVSLRSGDGHSTRTTSFGRVTTTVQSVANASGNSTATTTNPDGTQEVSALKGNLVAQVTTYDTQGNALLSKIYAYDALRRVANITDTRIGTTTINGYTSAGQILSQTDPGNRVTAFAYDVMGRKVMVDMPDTQDASGANLANVTRTSWYSTGWEKASWGDQTYPVFKSYDEQGRMYELRTYRALAHGIEPTTATSGFDLTTWAYNELGLLAAKRYADNQGPSYTYTPGGKLATRTWARGVVTSYTYDKGFLIRNDYSDATPDVTIGYDALGRRTSLVQANQSRIDYAYDPVTLTLDTETIAYDLDHDGTIDFTRVLGRSRDNLQRDIGWQLKNGTTVENAVSYFYSATTGWISQISNPQTNHAFAYTYVPGSSLIASATGPAHTVVNTWAADRDALLVKENKIGATTISRFEYGVNPLGQRISVAANGNAFSGTLAWDWGYNARGEVTKADSPVADLDRAYEYDAIGNRKKSAESLTLPSEDNYTANALNQYSSINKLSTINLNYDDDGNITNGPNANSTLSWDGENRLIAATVNGVTSQYLYDALSRRIAKIHGSTTELTVYDDWNPIADYAGTALSKGYIWGFDLSGNLQSSGGVGGLLSVTDHGSLSTDHFFPAYDGNGNVSEYLTSAGAVEAHFEYDTFGRVVVVFGNSSNFSIRFSTKKEDSESGLNYYGYRYYNSTTGRWSSRDPIEEKGGDNLYCMVGNNALCWFDGLGLYPQGGYPDWGGKNVPPPYKPVPSQGNCWRYACNDPGGPHSPTPNNWSPNGGPGSDPTGAKNCPTLMAAVQSKGGSAPGSSGCPKCTYKITVQYSDNVPGPRGPQQDMHFSRQDPKTGQWSDKPGNTRVRPLPDSSPSPRYIKCGEWCLPEGTKA
jgi:RHS repeat-associated protein